MEKVSVIMPVYNDEKHLKTSIKSLLKQTYKNIHIILVDDGSTDSSGKICDEFANKYNNITVIHKENGGAITARNEGIKILPKEGYTTFLDSDDIMLEDGVEKLVDLAVFSNADITSGTLQKFIINSRIRMKKDTSPLLSKRFVFEKEDIKKIYSSFFGVSDFTGYMHTKLYKNSLLKESLSFETPVYHFQEDIAFNLQAVLKSKKIAVMPDTINLYRFGGSTSHFMPNYLEDCISLYYFKINQIKKNQLDKNFIFTSQVELKNEYFCWLQMYFEHYKGMKNKEKVMCEIKKCNSLECIQSAVSFSKIDYSGVSGFKELVEKNDLESIYKMLCDDYKKNRLKKIIKKVIKSIS